MIGACKCNRQKWKTQEGSDRWQCESENALLWHEPSEMSDNIIVSGLNVQTDMMFRLIGWMPLTRLMLKFHYLIILLRCPIVRIKARTAGSVRKPFPGLFCIHKCVRQISDLILYGFCVKLNWKNCFLCANTNSQKQHIPCGWLRYDGVSSLRGLAVGCLHPGLDAPKESGGLKEGWVSRVYVIRSPGIFHFQKTMKALEPSARIRR